MINLKKYVRILKLFVIFLTFFSILACSKKNYSVSKIEAKRLPISNKIIQNQDIDNYVKPYREHINKELDQVLAYCPETLEKNDGKWQSTIGNLLADVTIQRANLVFKSREKKDIDWCILNNGGIRSILPKGDVSSRTAYEIMPFENSLVVVALKGEQVLEMISYFIANEKPHPLSGIRFTIDKKGQAKNILIQGKPVDKGQIYYAVTSDYLSNGGDSMNFFLKGIQKFDLNYKIRNVLIDYFKEVDSIPVIKEQRISME